MSAKSNFLKYGAIPKHMRYESLVGPQLMCQAILLSGKIALKTSVISWAEL